MSRRPLFAIVVLCSAGAGCHDVDGAPNATSPGSDSALSVFERRVLPIFKSPKPSSCSECHLSGVDLKDYIRPTQAETFAALVASGMVDTKETDRSKILGFIGRKPEKPSLVTEKVRKEEYEAFRAWLRAAVREPDLLSAKSTDEPFGPKVSEEVIRHARSDRVLASFVENVWSEIGRCAACHSPEKNAEQVKKHGEQVSWITPRDPEATMRHMLDAGIIDAETPEESLLLAKPTERVKHGGGQKMVVGDRSYKQLRRFLDDYAATAGGEYRTADDLPRPAGEVSEVSEIWFKLTDVPEEFDQKLLQVDLYRQEGDGWSKDRWATSDRPVFGKGRLWQHSLGLTAPRGSARAEEIRGRQTLPAGRYLAKIYVDRSGKLAADFRAEMGAEDLWGEIEVESRWAEGYGEMTEAPFPESRLRR
ncbi:MAG: hypothetical protein M3552_01845 [Planctomycetota bacterium]|nr:hypothetical protein [Planctomycetaceae bacterium]MDQ3329390.1 hypothetical protein [Planctomycetota bacterium]